MEKYFDLILIEEEMGYGKPDPRVFKTALEHLDTRPANILMIGDNLVWDLQGAQAIGIKAIWFNWKRIMLPQEVNVVPDGAITELLELSRYQYTF